MPDTPQLPDDGFRIDADLRRRLDFDDARLLAECDVHFHRTGGPGGQHRNKVSSAVRLHHKPSGAVATASERRSQHENRANAVLRLREAIALYTRAPLPEAIVWPQRVTIAGGRLRVGERNPGYLHVLALALDALLEFRGVPQDAGKALGVTATSLVRFLADHPKAWGEAQRMRATFNLPPLHA